MQEINKEDLKKLHLAADVFFYLTVWPTEKFWLKKDGPISSFFIKKDGEIQRLYSGVCQFR